MDFFENRKSARKVSSMHECFENSNMQWEKPKKSRKAKWWKVNMRYVPIYLQHGLVVLSQTSRTFLLFWLPLFSSSWRIGRGRVCNLTPHLLGCLYRSVVVGSWLGDVTLSLSCVLGPDLMLIIEHCSFLGWNGNFSSKRCSNLFFQKILMLENIFGFFWKQKKC